MVPGDTGRGIEGDEALYVNQYERRDNTYSTTFPNLFLLVPLVTEAITISPAWQSCQSCNLQEYAGTQPAEQPFHPHSELEGT